MNGKRGFPEPHGRAECALDEDELVVLKISKFERKLMRAGDGVSGKFVLMTNPRDRSVELVRVSE